MPCAAPGSPSRVARAEITPKNLTSGTYPKDTPQDHPGPPKSRRQWFNFVEAADFSSQGDSSEPQSIHGKRVPELILMSSTMSVPALVIWPAARRATLLIGSRS